MTRLCVREPGFVFLIKPYLAKIYHISYSMAIRGYLLRRFGNLLSAQQGLALEIGLQRFLSLPSFKSKLTFIKVGANDGLTGDPCGNKLLSGQKWTGHLIEPIPYVYDRLRSIYSDSTRFTCHQLAIGNRPGEALIYYISPSAILEIPDLPFYWDQLASFDRNHILKTLGSPIESYILARRVKVHTLHDFILQEHIGLVDLLHIDTEGHDLEVLKSLQLSPGFTPRIVLIEIKNLSIADQSLVVETLLDAGYSHLIYGDNDLAACKDKLLGICISLYGWSAALIKWFIRRMLLPIHMTAGAEQ